MTSPDLPALIAEVRRLDAEATKGPWAVTGGYLSNARGEPKRVCVEATCRVNGNRGYSTATTGLFDEPGSFPDAALIAAYRTAAPLLADECDRLQASLEHTQYWYSVRLEHLHRWAHTKLSAELRTEYFSIVANGHEDGAPPTYAQKMNVLSHARDKADAECSRLQAEVTQLRAERDMPCAHRLEEERLQERVRVLEEALRPFAEIRAAGVARGEWIRIDHAEPFMRLTNWCDAARAALEGIESP